MKMRAVACRTHAPCPHLLAAELCARSAGRSERLFLAGHSAGGQISADYAQRLAGGLILLARAQHHVACWACCVRCGCLRPLRTRRSADGPVLLACIGHSCVGLPSMLCPPACNCSAPVHYLPPWQMVSPCWQPPSATAPRTTAAVMHPGWKSANLASESRTRRRQQTR